MRMKRRILPLLFLFLTVQIGFAQQFSVGTAQRNINPNGLRLFMAGGKPNRPFTDVHDSLYVKAVVVSDGRTDLAQELGCTGGRYDDLFEAALPSGHIGVGRRGLVRVGRPRRHQTGCREDIFIGTHMCFPR